MNIKNEIDIKRVQNVLLTMAKETTKILEKYEIPYMLAYGSLLGAVRHRGFIPWDDDFDFYLFDDTYEQAIQCLRAELPEFMFVEDEFSEPLYFHDWAHIKDTMSVTECHEFPQDGCYMHKGLSLDMYRTKEMKLMNLEHFLNDKNSLYIEKRKQKGCFSEKEYNMRLEKLIENRKRENKYHGNDTIVYNILPTYSCHYIRKDDIFPLRKYEFCDHQFYGPNHADLILRNIYGDYMTLPPLENRRHHYSSVIFK